MNRVRVLLIAVLALSLPGLGQAKFHLFRTKHPRVAPGGQILGPQAKMPKVAKHKAHTAKHEGH